MSVVDISKMGATPVQDAEIVAERTPEIVAAEIRQIADQTRKMVLNSSIEIGKRLCEAKEMVPHGEWTAWLEKNVDFSQSSANNFMKIYTEYGDIQGELWGASAKSQTFGNLSYSQAVALLAVPAEEREEFVKENHVEDMSTRELQEAIKARDTAMEEATKSWETEREKILKENQKITKSLDYANKKLEIANKKLEMEKELHDKQHNAAEAVKQEQAEEIARLKEQLAKAEEKESTATLEEAAEIARLREQLKKAESLGAERMASDEEVARFKVLFQTVQNNFSDLMDAMVCIKDMGAKAKRKAAIGKLLEKLMEELDNYE